MSMRLKSGSILMGDDFNGMQMWSGLPGSPSTGGGSTPSPGIDGQYFTDDAQANAYYTDDAQSNPYKAKD